MEIPGWGQFVQLIETVLISLSLWTGSSGVAIILITIAIKTLLLPLTLKSLRSARRMQELQPLLKELQRKHGDDRQALSAETMRLYQEHKVNPFGSCLPILIQMPIFFGLYYAILNITRTEFLTEQGLEGAFNVGFLWVPNLAIPDPTYLFVVIVTITQFISQRMATPQRVPGQELDQQARMMNQMMMFMPLMVGFFAVTFPAGPVLYWITQNVYSAVQQFFITGFGSLRDLPGMHWLPVPPWVTPPVAAGKGDSKVIVTKSRAPEPTPNREPSGFMGQLYSQINKRVEEVDRQRQARDGGAGEQRATPPPPPTASDEARPGRRSSARRARPKR